MHIFGYPIYTAKMEGHEHYQNQFMPFLKDDNFFMKHDQWASRNDTCMGHPRKHEMPWEDVTQEAIRHVFKYLEQFHPKGNAVCYADPWLNRYYKGDYQEVHTHSAINTTLSCAYMLIQPDNDTNFCFVDKTQDYWNQVDLGRFCYNVPEKAFEPPQEEGTIIIFPSHLEHFVKENRSNNMRASISMNFLLGEQHE